MTEDNKKCDETETSDEDELDFDERFPVIEQANELPSTSKHHQQEKVLNIEKAAPCGIVYMSIIPPGLKLNLLRKIMSQFGEIGRIYLVPAEKGYGKRHHHFKEGWIEFKNKSIGKRVAKLMNNTVVGGKNKAEYKDAIWNLKYLKGFRWLHLTEQIAFEKAVHQARMRAEITMAKKRANYFADQVEKGQHLKKLEEKVLKKGGLWNKYQRQMLQKKPIKKVDEKDDTVLNMVFS